MIATRNIRELTKCVPEFSSEEQLVQFSSALQGRTSAWLIRQPGQSVKVADSRGWIFHNDFLLLMLSISGV